jgi:hypothetical protein
MVIIVVCGIGRVRFSGPPSRFEAYVQGINEQSIDDIRRISYEF